MNTNRNIAIAICAHPDDAEFMCTGTLALLKQKGWEIHIATMTPGDCGSATHRREEISRIRRAEAAESTKLLGGQTIALNVMMCLSCMTGRRFLKP